MDFFFRDQTPPNTPQRVRTAARQSERDSRTLDSPEHRRIPQQPIHHPQIQPLHFDNIPVPPPPQNAMALDDPFAPLPQVNFNGQQYHHLPPELAQRVQNLIPAHGHGQGHVPPVSVL